ncbi:MAG: GAF domain-containing protein [Rubrivivax sp.]|nr:GAF domain-containing protein [Rubrivivax sp.]
MDSPAFGQADLSNCERELIHLAGSVQPHGALLLVQEGTLTVLQASSNCAALLGVAAETLLERPLTALGGDLAQQVVALAGTLAEEPASLLGTVAPVAGAATRRVEGALHRAPEGGLVLELEVFDPAPGLPTAPHLAGAALHARLAEAAQRFTAAPSVGALTDAIASEVRDLTGYDRVMVYRFDTDGHGKIVSEARDPRLESLLGHHYPASDIPQRARELYLRNRVRLLVDVDYEPQALMPPLRPDNGRPLDMSMCQLRSMSPLHLQYLRNMGVTGTLVASLVREGRLWGLIAAHHYSPRHLRVSMRAAVDLLAEVASTRIASIEHYAHTQVALMVQRLEQRLVEATATEGDWRLALFRNPQTLLQPLEATGAALFQGSEIFTTGEVPSTPELRALCRWVDTQAGGESPFSCSSVGKVHPPLASLTPTASGVIAVKLSNAQADYLMWFRKEQLLTVTWAGDPHKPMEGDDPLQLSPRRSFAAWSEIVRGTAMPWTKRESIMARAIGAALVDIIVQVHAVRMLIAERQLAQIREAVGNSREPVLLVDAAGGLLFANAAFAALRDAGAPAPVKGAPVATLFRDPGFVQRVFSNGSAQAWRGEWRVNSGPAGGLPVGVRVEGVPARDGTLLGHIVVLTDLRDTHRAAEARRQLEASLLVASAGLRRSGPPDEVMAAIFANARLAAMDIAEAAGDPSVAPLLEEVEASTRRAAALCERLRRALG